MEPALCERRLSFHATSNQKGRHPSWVSALFLRRRRGNQAGQLPCFDRPLCLFAGAVFAYLQVHGFVSPAQPSGSLLTRGKRGDIEAKPQIPVSDTPRGCLPCFCARVRSSNPAPAPLLETSLLICRRGYCILAGAGFVSSPQSNARLRGGGKAKDIHAEHEIPVSNEAPHSRCFFCSVVTRTRNLTQRRTRSATAHGFVSSPQSNARLRGGGKAKDIHAEHEIPVSNEAPHSRCFFRSVVTRTRYHFPYVI